MTFIAEFLPSFVTGRALQLFRIGDGLNSQDRSCGSQSQSAQSDGSQTHRIERKWRRSGMANDCARHIISSLDNCFSLPTDVIPDDEGAA
jgi:hypothetical protein